MSDPGAPVSPGLRAIFADLAEANPAQLADGPLAPAVLEEIAQHLARIVRPVSARQLSVRLLQLATTLAEGPPMRSLCLIIAATALLEVAECSRERTLPAPPYNPSL